ncbi:MAG: amino acid ABC transporter substrate-binding protein [Bacteroidetes bacterium]|nr:amino acid ABC transporter substrate-binding protein [Bacteroidota bacterium]
MKSWIRYFLLIILFVSAVKIQAQTEPVDKPKHIAFFVPLYLDSAFDDTGNYRYDKNFPKFLSPGLEFYEGAQLALDSLKKEGLKLEISLYDTKSRTKSIQDIVQSEGFQNTELIIGHISPSEIRLLANAAYLKKIPFINTNYPNDGNILNNPSLVILNSTLKTHCEGIYKFLQKNYATSNITVFGKNGLMEQRLKSYFSDAEKSTLSVPLKLKFISVDNNINPEQLSKYLDSNIQNICVLASLDENFARTFCAQVSALGKSYHTTIMGMPTWDNIDFLPEEYSGPEIIYSTPFYINPNDSLVKSIQQYFYTNYFMKGSDMIIRGFETTYHFAKLLNLFGSDLTNHIDSKKFEVINNFDIEPVYTNKQNTSPDYYENKKLYFVKRVDGKVTAVY